MRRAARLAFIAVALLATVSAAHGLELIPHRSSAAARSLLLSYQQPSFWSLVPQRCYRGQYGSPYRLLLDSSITQGSSTTFNFRLYTVDCPVTGSACCNARLDHLLLRIGHGISITSASLDGQALPMQRLKRGLQLDATYMVPSPAYQTAMLQVVTDTPGISSISQLCPLSRYPGGCDYVAYSADEVCCPESSALPSLLVKPLPFTRPRTLPPPPSTEQASAPPPRRAPTTAFAAPPSPSTSQATGGAAMPPSPQQPAGSGPSGEMQATQEARSPPPAQLTPASTPYDPLLRCVEDQSRSPFRLMWVEAGATGYDTTFTFQLWRVTPSSTMEPDGIPHPGDCSNMAAQRLMLQVHSSANVQAVAFDGMLVEHSLLPDTPDSNWLILDVNMTAQDLAFGVPRDLSVTVRGSQTSLCPASGDFRSASSCEFVVQGRSQVSECCTHGISRTAPSMPSCTDDSERSPFVLEVATALQDPLANTTRFDMRVAMQPASAPEAGDPFPEGDCSAMSLANVSVEIRSDVRVLAALVDGREVEAAYRSATDRSRWLTFTGLGEPYAALGQRALPRLTLLVEGQHDTACAAADLFPTRSSSCQYLVQGRHRAQSCCARGVSRHGEPELCGCSDDLSQQPFRLMFDSVDRTGDNTTFTFMLHADSMSTAMMGSMGADMDGLNARHNCSSMAVQWLELELFRNLQVLDVNVAGVSYQYQRHQSARNAAWLQLFNVQASQQQYGGDGTALPISVTVQGRVNALCPAHSDYHSLHACQYVLHGSPSCCPKGITAAGMVGHRRRGLAQAQAYPGHVVYSLGAARSRL